MFNFKFDKKIKTGVFSSKYFLKSEKISKQFNKNDIVCLQFRHFSNEPVCICGIEEVVQLLKYCISKEDLKKISVLAVKDGDMVDQNSPIMLINGPYYVFARYENIIDGIIARRSSVCNNCHKILNLIHTSQLIYMAERTDDYLLQPFDGYSAYVGGVRHFVTDAAIALLPKQDKSIKVSGTIPHALIQTFDGNLVDALKAYKTIYQKDRLIALVDYHNDVCQEIKALAKAKLDIFAVRIDTSRQLMDEGLLRIKKKKDKKYFGVNHDLVMLARKQLDTLGMQQTKIIVSGGLDYEMVKDFINKKSPIDYFGIGSSLITRNVHITADLVLKNNQPQSKVGRHYLYINNKKNLKKII